MSATRTLDYCAVRSLCGRETADEMFGRKLPIGFDIDHQADQDMVTRIAAERARCDTCPDRSSAPNRAAHSRQALVSFSARPGDPRGAPLTTA